MPVDRPHLYKPGESGNPNGRKPGSKNKINRDFYAAYEAVKELDGYQHPLRLMYDWAMDQSKPIEIRAAMLKEFASYLCHKPKQTIAIERDVPVFQSETQAEEFLAEFISTIAPDLDPVELATMTRQYIMSKREGQELQLKTNPPELAPQRVIIEGGLPHLPGTDVIMPKYDQSNGHDKTIDLEKNVGPTLAASETAPLPAPDAGLPTSQDPQP